MARRRRTPKRTGPRLYTYYFRILEWHVKCRNEYNGEIVQEKDENSGPFGQHEVRRTYTEHWNSVRLQVELLNPVKSVVKGEFGILSVRKLETLTDFYPKHLRFEKRPEEDGGGVLWSRWDDDHTYKTFSGVTHVGDCSFLALVQVLTAGRPVIVYLRGEEFYRNTARIKGVGWFTEGDPDLIEEVEYAIEKSLPKRKNWSPL